MPVQPIPPQDRPKVMAVVAGIVVALGFGAWNLLRPRTPPQGVVAASASAGPAMGTPEPNASPGAPPAAVAGGATLPSAERRLRDPFQPIGATLTTGTTSSPARPVSPPLGEIPREIVRAGPPPPLLPRVTPIEPGGDPATGPSLLPASPRLPVPASPPSGPQPPVALIGTVGAGAGGVAAFRVGEGIVHVRPTGTIAGWHVVRIGPATVWLVRGSARRRVRLGDAIPNDSPTDSAALAASGA